MKPAARGAIVGLGLAFGLAYVFDLVPIGCNPDHRTRIASKNGQDCARIHFVEHGLYPDWNIESDAGPANVGTLREAEDFAKRACGGGEVQIRIEH